MSGNFLLLSGYNARGQAYAQAMIKAGITPDRVVLYGDSDRDIPRPEAARPSEFSDELYLPDLTVTLRQSCETQCWNVMALAAESVNDREIAAAIEDASPGLIVYAGYGGQLVGRDVLDLGYPIMHCHSGWLPEFRGSTTIYYSFLAESSCAVSAIILDADIDTGPVLLRQRYPVPTGMDVDFLYDNAVRADTMIKVIRDYVANGTLPAGEPQPEAGTTYYVIHPLLKHAALSMMPKGATETIGVPPEPREHDV